MQSHTYSPVLTPQPSQVVDKNHLARLTGHSNADSANRIWYIARNKLTKADSLAESATSLVDVDTPTKGPKKTATKMRTQTAKKRRKKQVEDEEEKPAPKRVKKVAVNDAGVDVQDEL